jgi:hypothetical protein
MIDGMTRRILEIWRKARSRIVDFGGWMKLLTWVTVAKSFSSLSATAVPSGQLYSHFIQESLGSSHWKIDAAVIYHWDWRQQLYSEKRRGLKPIGKLHVNVED